MNACTAAISLPRLFGQTVEPETVAPETVGPVDKMTWLSCLVFLEHLWRFFSKKSFKNPLSHDAASSHIMICASHVKLWFSPPHPIFKNEQMSLTTYPPKKSIYLEFYA